MTRLFVIGNGFDLAHGLKTKYCDFKKFVYEEDKNGKTYDIIEQAEQEYNKRVGDSEKSSNWSSFEELIRFH